MLMMHHEDMKRNQNILRQAFTTQNNDPSISAQLSKQVLKATNKLATMQDWLDSGYRKIVLTADDKEWSALQSEIPEEDRVIVRDAGLVEVPVGSETCFGVFPIRKSQRCKTLKRLQVLK
jgi:peptidyl-tRNA hydrolase